MRVLVNNDIIKVTCGKCKSVLGVEAADIQVDDIGHHGPAQWVTCPQCGATVGVSRSQIPNHWLATVFRNCD